MTFEGTETLATAAGARAGAASEEEVASVWLLLVVSTAMSCTTLSLWERMDATRATLSSVVSSASPLNSTSMSLHPQATRRHRHQLLFLHSTVVCGA